MYFFENKIGWHLLYEDEAYSMYYYGVWINFFENIPDY